MKRHVFHLLLAALIGIVAFNNVVVGDDKVERRDRKTDKRVIVSGKITEEKIDGIKMKVSGKDELIPSADIVRVSYDDLPVAAKLVDNSLFINEEKEKDHSKTIKQYQDLSEKAKGGSAACGAALLQVPHGSPASNHGGERNATGGGGQGLAIVRRY